MKKLLVVLMVLAFVAPAMADDTLDVSGAYRVEYYDIANSNFTDADANQPDYWDQRFRLQFKIKPADGIQAVLRGDFVETNWGTFETRPAPGNAVMMIDKAYVSVDKGMVNITAGLQGWTLGDAFGYANQDTGLAITIKPKPVTVKLGFVKEVENGQEDETDANKDINHYFLDVGYKGGGISANVYYAMQQDGTDPAGGADEPTMLGALVKGKVAMVNLKAFIEMFGGQQSDTVDYQGIQLYVDANAKLSDALKLGAELVYSDGENDADKAKTTRFTNANSGYRQYLERGPMMGTLGLRAFGGDDIFDIGGNAGSMGLRPYVEFKAMPELTLYANLGYFVASEDVDLAESALTYSLGASYALAPKTTLGLQYLAVDLSEDGDYAGTDFETYSALAAIMRVKF